jgi:hypothetical protein
MDYRYSVFVFALALVLVGAGCTVNNQIGEVTTTPAAAPSATSTEATGGWDTNAVSQGSISGTPIAGTVNGEAFSVAHVQVDQQNGKYRWSFSDKDNTSTCSFATGDNAVKFSTSELVVGSFAKGYDDEVEYDDFSAYYKYAKDDGSPHSVNTGWAANVVVTDVTRGVEKSTFGNDVGTISGFADFMFEDGKTAISGAFTAELCEK